MKTKRKKKALTLLEIMIVIVLIGLIGSVVGFNMKGSLDEGKAFKTKQARDQIVDILMLEVARGAEIQQVIEDPEKYLNNSGLIKNAKNYLRDGWGNPFEIKAGSNSNNPIVVKSDKLNAYERRKNEKLGKSLPTPEEEDSEDASQL